MTIPSTELLQKLLDSTPALVLVKDREGRFIYLNRRAAVFSRGRRGVTLGKRIDAFVSPKLAREMDTLDKRVMATGAPLEREVDTDINGIPRTWLSLRVPIGDKAGKICGVGIIATDITARKRAERLLSESEERYRLLTENVSGYSIFIMDAEGRVLTWNKQCERARGYKAAEIVGRSAAKLCSPTRVGKLIATAKREGRAESIAWRVRRDGSRFWATVTVIALRDGPGGLKGFAVLTHDVSEPRRLKENLDISRRIMQAGEEERRRISKELHDGVGSRLSSAKLMIHSLEDRIRRSDVRSAETASRTSAILGDVLLETRRIIRNLRPPLLDDLGLAPALRNLFDDLTRTTGIRVRLRCVFPRRRLSLEKEFAVYRIVQEALANVAEHSGASLLTVDLRRRGDALFVSMRDNGRGIRGARRGRVRGFGIINMKERAILLGGKVNVLSAPGKGTDVRLELPF